jgi:hypothetical protein
LGANVILSPGTKEHREGQKDIFPKKMMIFIKGKNEILVNMLNAVEMKAQIDKNEVNE